jgi:spore germination protein KB
MPRAQAACPVAQIHPPRRPQMDKNEKVLRAEYFFLVYCFTLRFVEVLNFTDTTAKNDAWLVIIAGAAIAVPFIVIFTSLAKRFPSKTLLEIYPLVLGKVPGTIILILYTAYFHVISSHFLDDLAEFFSIYVQPDTPLIFFIIVFTLSCAIVLRMGIEYLVKTCFIIALSGSITALATSLMLLREMDFSNFLPILRQEPRVYLESVSQFAFVPGVHVLILFMLNPKFHSKRGITKLTVIGFGLGVLSLLTISIRNTAVLGSVATVVNSPSYYTLRLIDIGELFTRVDFAASINITILTFLATSIVYYSAVQGLNLLFKPKNKNFFIIPSGIIIDILSVFLFDSSMEHLEFAKNYNVPVYGCFYFVFPPLALIVAKLRRIKEADAELTFQSATKKTSQ